MGAFPTVYDPMFKGEEVFGLRVTNDLAEASARVKDADCVVIGTAHKEIRSIDLTWLSELCRKPAALVDSRNVVDPPTAKMHRFAY